MLVYNKVTSNSIALHFSWLHVKWKVLLYEIGLSFQDIKYEVIDLSILLAKKDQYM